jgi:SPP1 family predicted phage head-tail adaptor
MVCKKKCKDDFGGKARHRILVERQALTGDDYGGASNTWTTVGNYWAMMKPLSGREVFATEQNMSRVTHSFTIRYQSGLKNTKDIGSYRITFEDRLFEVKFVRNLDETRKNEGRVYQELIAEENGALPA